MRTPRNAARNGPADPVFARRDRRVYLDLLRDQAARTGLRILAICLMRNHIHLIAIPERDDSLAVCLRRVHGRYAQYLNARRGRSGHLWTALRYVERNPVRAGLLESAERYRWSSAAAHLSGKDPFGLLDVRFWEESGGSAFWRQLLDNEDDEEELQRLRKATYGGKPLGSAEFSTSAKRAPTGESLPKAARRSA